MKNRTLGSVFIVAGTTIGAGMLAMPLAAAGVGFGVTLEHRYKGIRTPHKMKFGVSGCTRECAEAQGKDVGIIATENGMSRRIPVWAPSPNVISAAAASG